ncbi:hypothetical protein DQM17_12885, partial [Lacticaseibacillus paracasei]
YLLIAGGFGVIIGHCLGHSENWRQWIE